jgi:hypothetical protein
LERDLQGSDYPMLHEWIGTRDFGPSGASETNRFKEIGAMLMKILRWSAVFLFFLIPGGIVCAQGDGPSEDGVLAFTLLANDGGIPEKSLPAEVAPDQTAPVGNRETFFSGVTFSGLIDAYYEFNFNRPSTRENALRNFDIRHNQFSLNLLELAMERKAEPLGFRVDLNFGDAAKMASASEPGGANLYQFLQQAYISYKAPVAKGLTVDLGKFVTPLGAEVIETPANYNYSRSLLFAWAIPYHHFGARISYPLTDKISLSGSLTNGWNNVVDNNGGKTAHVGLSLTPFSWLSIVQNYMVGPEQAENSEDKRQVLDTIVTITLNEKLSLMGNYDYGMDRIAGVRSRYQGVAAYMRYAPSSRFAISPRVEWFTDPQGLATGSVQTLKEGTLTCEFKLRLDALLRAEFRHDWSNIQFFETRSGDLAHSQDTVAFGFIYLLGQ